MVTLSASLTDTVGITETFSRRLVFGRPLTDTAGVTETVKIKLKINLLDTVGIVGHLRQRAYMADSVGMDGTVAVHGSLVQFDTWRPIPKPDNSLILLCRTPVGEHDSPTGLTHLTLWTILPDGMDEHPVLLSPADNGYGWSSYSHPEWSPSGDDVLVAAETSTTYKLVVLDATGFGS